MGFITMATSFWLDNGFRIGEAIKDARLFELNTRAINKNLKEYKSSLQHTFAVVESGILIFEEKVTEIKVYANDCVCIITLFEDETPMSINVKTLHSLQENDFYFGNTLADMLQHVNTSEKLDSESAHSRVKELLSEYKTRYSHRLTETQIEEALLKASSVLTK